MLVRLHIVMLKGVIHKTFGNSEGISEQLPKIKFAMT